MHEVEDPHTRSTQDGDDAPQSPSTFTSHLRQSFAGVQGPHSPGAMRRTRRRHDHTTHAWYRHDFTRMVRGRCAAPAVYRSCSMVEQRAERCKSQRNRHVRRSKDAKIFSPLAARKQFSHHFACRKRGSPRLGVGWSGTVRDGPGPMGSVGNGVGCVKADVTVV